MKSFKFLAYYVPLVYVFHKDIRRESEALVSVVQIIVVPARFQKIQHNIQPYHNHKISLTHLIDSLLFTTWSGLGTSLLL